MAVGNTKKFVVKNGLRTQNIDFVSPDSQSVVTQSISNNGVLSFDGVIEATSFGGVNAENVDYNNSTSGLAATDVQAAIDEVTGDLGTMSTQDANNVTVSGGTVNLAANGLTVGTDQLVTSGGNVGIGTSSPAFAAGGGVQAKNATFVSFRASGGSSIGTDFAGDSVGNGYVFNRDNASVIFGTTNTERMRITAGGNLLVGTSTFGGDGGLSIDPKNPSTEGSPALVVWNKGNAALETAAEFRRNGSAIGSITYTGTAVAYNTSSDYRLKEDLQPVEDPIGRLKQLKPFNFAWKVDGTRVDGFLAHEAQEVVPEAITGTKDAMRTEEYEVSPAVLDEDGTVVEEAVMGEREVPDYQGIDQAKLVPLLTAALQDAVAKIESLEQRIQALEGGQA